MDYEQLDDHELVDGILNNDKDIIKYFFTKKCRGLISYLLLNVFNGRTDRHAVLSELYLFLANKDWYVFRIFQYRSKLMTYVSVVTLRFFIKNKMRMIDMSFQDSLNNQKVLISNTTASIDLRIDIKDALNRMPNPRYRKVIDRLYLHDVQPEKLAEEMKITVDNLYNIHRRALIQLRLVINKREDYV